MHLNNKKGIALVAALALLIVASGVIVLIFNSTLREMDHSKDDINITRSLMLVRSVAKMTDRFFQVSVKYKLRAIVNDEADTVNAWQFGDGPLIGEPSPETVIADLMPVVSRLQGQLDRMLCNRQIQQIGSSFKVKLQIYVDPTVADTDCLPALPTNIRVPAPRFVSGAGRTYAIPYVVVVEASNNEYKRNLVIQGEYRFVMNGDRFSKYALFTDAARTKDGDPVWFTDDTLLEGPIHTNEYFRFFKEPWFGGQVTSAGYVGNERRPSKKGGLFYSQGFVDEADLDSSPSFTWPDDPTIVDKPVFSDGVDWSAHKVSLPSSNINSRENRLLIDSANDEGLFIDGDLFKLETWAADAGGNRLRSDGRGGWQPSSVYQYLKACGAEEETSCKTYRFAEDGPLMVSTQNGWELVHPNPPNEPFSGVIYTNGKIRRLTGPSRVNNSDIDSAPPSIASFAHLNITATDTIRITGDLKYEDLPCTGYPSRDANGNISPSVCDNLEAKNILGVYSVNSDILIGNNHTNNDLNAPNDVVINASLMSGNGVVEVENFDTGNARGNVHLLGGIIQKYYGGFGTFDSDNGNSLTGFGRLVSYDQRFGIGMSPPAFPGANSTRIMGVFNLKYGQSEQVY